MPEFVHWLSVNPVRWVIPAVLLAAMAGVPLMLWWERRHPSVPEDVAAMRSWRALSTQEQEAVDTAALNFGEQAELDAVAEAEEAAQLLVQRAQVNALFHP